MFKDFSDIEFAKLLIVMEVYELPCSELIKKLEEANIPFELVSKLVNIQRSEYGLDKKEHNDYRSILLDKVVCDKDYYFRCENLKLVLSSLIVTRRFDSSNSAFSDAVKIVKRGEKFLSFKIGFKYSVEEYLNVIGC